MFESVSSITAPSRRAVDGSRRAHHAFRRPTSPERWRSVAQLTCYKSILAAGTFLDAKRNAIFIGGTGTGKTHLCIAVASAVIRARARGRFFNLVDLVNQLEQEKAAGRSGRLAEKLLRHDLIVIDQLGYLSFSQSGAQLLFHLISNSMRTHRC